MSSKQKHVERALARLGATAVAAELLWRHFQPRPISQDVAMEDETLLEAAADIVRNVDAPTREHEQRRQLLDALRAQYRIDGAAAGSPQKGASGAAEDTETLNVVTTLGAPTPPDIKSTFAAAETYLEEARRTPLTELRRKHASATRV